jgi:hypothetical protein
VRPAGFGGVFGRAATPPILRPRAPPVHEKSTAVRLRARRAGVAPFAVPAAAFAALDALARTARVAGFAESPCGAEETVVLAVWLDAVLNDEGREEERCQPPRPEH